MKIAFASSEAVPYAKTGGLADVAGSLPKALEKLGCEVKVFIPKYSRVDDDRFDLQYCWDIGEIPIRMTGQIKIAHMYQAKLPNSKVEINFIDCPYYFFRNGIYTNDSDEDQRFIFFQKGVLEALQRLRWKPDIIHCNDWQTGLLPLYIKDNYSWDDLFRNTKSLFTIHNIGYQGRFPHSAMLHTELKEGYYYPGGPVEFENTVSFMKAGLSFADKINTVSKKYAEEILTPEYGAGLDTLLKSRSSDLSGILNGIDYEAWNPETDKFIHHHYSSKDLSGKLENKKFLMEKFHLPFNEKVPLIGIISRMATQKGFDIFLDAANDIINLNAQWIILGNGEENYENFFRELSFRYPDKAAVYIGFNNELSHLVEAGADIFVMPSHYEPCGLNQIYSLRYGTVPVVRKTGGLADTVQDWDDDHDTGCGFSFNDYTGFALYNAVKRAIDTFPNKKVWNKIQTNGMSKDYSWEYSAKEYLNLYEQALAK